MTEAEAALAEADDRLAGGSASLQSPGGGAHRGAGARSTSLHDPAEAVDESSLAEEIEWYLLARLAAQRSVCLGGSLPLLLDDALGGPRRGPARPCPRPPRADGRRGAGHRGHRRPVAASWALLAGQDRAAVVRPQPA